MEVEIRRRYQHSLSQLAQVLPVACESCFPEITFDKRSSISLELHTRRSPLLGGGEKVSLMICPPGEIILRSRYLGRQPLLNLGQNEANLRRLVCRLDELCSQIPPACFYCGTVASPGEHSCAKCSLPLHEDHGPQPLRLQLVREHVAVLLWAGAGLAVLACTMLALL